MVVQSNNENHGTNKGSPGPAGEAEAEAEAGPLCKAATDITHHVGEANQGKDDHADGVTTCEPSEMGGICAVFGGLFKVQRVAWLGWRFCFCGVCGG